MFIPSQAAAAFSESVLEVPKPGSAQSGVRYDQSAPNIPGSAGGLKARSPVSGFTVPRKEMGHTDSLKPSH